MGYEDLDDDLRATYETAVQFSEQDEFLRAFAAIGRDPDLLAKAGEDPTAVLREYGVDVPGDVSVFVTTGGKPIPGEWYPFTIVLSNCRKFYKIDRTKRPPQIVETEPVCFTFTVVPTPVPGGPWG